MTQQTLKLKKKIALLIYNLILLNETSHRFLATTRLFSEGKHPHFSRS
jgi:hypothetical protein